MDRLAIYWFEKFFYCLGESAYMITKVNVDVENVLHCYSVNPRAKNCEGWTIGLLLIPVLCYGVNLSQQQNKYVDI